MPGYGLLGPDRGHAGSSPWEWAHERLVASHDFWLATVRPDGRPHLMPVWGVWDGVSLWFSSANGSRKATEPPRASARCSVATDNAYEPVVLEGDARVGHRPGPARACARASRTASTAPTTAPR